jgi:short-subunit dehydrogenase
VEDLAGWAGPVDILVNNAGFGLAGVLTSLDPGEMESLIRVNLTAPVLLARALVPQMVERGAGHLVNVASVAGHLGVQGEAVYAATKAALIAFGESLRYELQGSGVGVTTVSPGVIATRFFEREGLPYTRRFPRPVRAERVANAIVSAIRRDRPQVFVPRWMWFPVWLRGTAPWLYRQGASRWG